MLTNVAFPADELLREYPVEGLYFDRTRRFSEVAVGWMVKGQKER